MAYHRLIHGFSRIHAISASCRIFCASTVARYAANPWNAGTWSPCGRRSSRAADLMPRKGKGKIAIHQLSFWTMRREREKEPESVVSLDSPSTATTKSPRITDPSSSSTEPPRSSYLATLLPNATTTPSSFARACSASCKCARCTT